MKDALIAAAIVVVLIVGFWWTRGAGPGANEIGSPGAEERAPMVRGKPLPTADEEIERERRGY
jgi:hypothetical protein